MSTYKDYFLFCYRDALLATLLDAVRGSGNRDVHVKSKPTALGKRWGPLHSQLEEEVWTVIG